MPHQTESHAPGLPPHPMARVTAPEPECPVELALTALAGRWTTLVVRELLGGSRSYGELARALPTLSDKVLTERLRHLERQGVLTRETRAYSPSNQGPVRVSYELTADGRRLGPLLQALWDWGRARSS